MLRSIVRDVDTRRLVPRTDLLLADPRLADAERRLGRALVKAAVARAQQRARDGQIAPEEVADAAVAELPARAAALTPVINATGVLVHTNLGRAPLSAAAVDAIVAAAGHCDVEFDLASGMRSRRGAGALDALARAVPAAEAVAVVNNNAAALVLAATALTSPGTDEIVVSRGELIEIGDRFRLPDLLEPTGARLREVGTTNRTTVADYADATGPRTAFILKVHPSNFRIEGFTAAAAVSELAGWGRCARGVRHRVRAARPAPAAGRRAERRDRAAGRRRPGHRERRQAARRPAGRPAARPRRPGAPADPAPAGPRAAGGQADPRRPGGHPRRTGTAGGRALAADPASLFDRAERAVVRLVAAGLDARVAAARAAVGGGGAPGVELDSAAVSLPESLAVPLRWDDGVARGELPAVVGRLEAGRLLLDLRSVAPADDDRLLHAILTATKAAAGFMIVASFGQ